MPGDREAGRGDSSDHISTVGFLKDDVDLMESDIAAEIVPGLGPRSPETAAVAARVYSRIGAMLNTLCKRHNVDLASVLTVWSTQSVSKMFVHGRAVLCLDLHLLFNNWGRRSREEFDAHFRFGGHNLQPGQPWENHEFRVSDTGRFVSVHHNQNSEYDALTLARLMAGDEVALRCACAGGPLLSLSAHLSLGYLTAMDMYNAFQESERAQVAGFFDYCRAKPAPRLGDLFVYLRSHDWIKFCEVL